MDEAQGPYLLEGDSPKGVPEEEGADEEARDRFNEIAAAGLGHRDLRVDERGWSRRETDGNMNFFIVTLRFFAERRDPYTVGNVLPPIPLRLPKSMPKGGE
jgi:hypothetical protein